MATNKTNNAPKVTINFAMWADDVHIQLKKQGFQFKEERHRKTYKDFKFSLNMLRVNGMLSDTECKNVCIRIMKRLVNDIE